MRASCVGLTLLELEEPSILQFTETIFVYFKSWPMAWSRSCWQVSAIDMGKGAVHAQSPRLVDEF